MCDVCCNLDKETVSFTENEDYTPDSSIVIDEPNRPEATHNPDDIRPGNEGISFIVYVDGEPVPSVTVDLDIPGEEDSYLTVSFLFHSEI